MPGTHSRDKGARGERELAELLGAVKVSGMYREGPDLQLPDGRFVEVKRSADGWKRLYRWLDDDASVLAVRADRRGWLIVMHLEDWLEPVEGSDDE